MKYFCKLSAVLFLKKKKKFQLQHFSATFGGKMIFSIVEPQSLTLGSSENLRHGTTAQQNTTHTAKVGADAVPADVAPQRFIKDRDLIVPSAAVSNGSIITPSATAAFNQVAPGSNQPPPYPSLPGSWIFYPHSRVTRLDMRVFR